MLGAPFWLLWSSPCLSWNSNGTWTETFGFTAVLQGLEDGENGRKSAKMGTLQRAQCHISMVLPRVWLNFQAPWDAGRLIIRLLRAQWIHHHHSIGAFWECRVSSCSSQVHFPGTVRISLASLGESSLLSASSSLWRTRESKYTIKLQHIALDDQGKSGGTLGPERQQ